MSRVWALRGARRGDNAQVRALAERTGASTRIIDLAYNRLRELPNHLLGGTLKTLRDTPDLAPPWPDMVIGAGRRSAPVARWIAERSGARLVWIGRPRAPLNWFSLILTTPQYRLCAAANVFEMTLPLSGEALADPPAASRTLAVVLGGDSWSMRVTPALVDRLGAAALRLARERGLEIRAVTSPRTPPGMAARLAERLGPGAEIHDWRAGGENPYWRNLAAASLCLVTSDSVSTLADAVSTGAPVSVVETPTRRWAIAAQRLNANGNSGFLAPPPAMTAIGDRLIAKGLARRGDDGLLHIETARPAVEAEHEAAAVRARALL